MDRRGWTPDNRERVKRATRFFARLESFDLECPHCGKVYQIRVRGLQRPSQRTYWEPSTARFKCTAKGGCQRRYVLGVVAWPVGTGPGAGSATPYDQIPHPRQLAALRREGGGWWMPDQAAITKRAALETNLTTEPERPIREDEDEDDWTH